MRVHDVVRVCVHAVDVELKLKSKASAHDAVDGRLDDGRVQLTARDITARIEAEQRIQRLAYFDSLTSLVNLEDIDNMFDEAIPEDPPVGLADLEVTATAACDLPEGVAVAKEIQNVVAETPELTWNMRERDPWWTLDEEEEEEEAQGGVGGG